MKITTKVVFSIFLKFSFLTLGYAGEVCPLETPSAQYSSVTNGIMHYSFKVNGEREATEIFMLKTGEKFTILHSGCEYETVTLNIESHQFYRAKKSIVAAYSAISKTLFLLAAIQPTSNYAVLIRSAALALQNEGIKTTPLELEDEISMSDFGELNAVVSVRSYSRNRKEGFAIVEINRGPL